MDDILITLPGEIPPLRKFTLTTTTTMRFFSEKVMASNRRVHYSKHLLPLFGNRIKLYARKGVFFNKKVLFRLICLPQKILPTATSVRSRTMFVTAVWLSQFTSKPELVLIKYLHQSQSQPYQKWKKTCLHFCSLFIPRLVQMQREDKKDEEAVSLLQCFASKKHQIVSH